MSTAIAFAVIYVVWGMSFLGMRYAVESIPPLGMAAIRFSISGLLLLALGYMRGERPTRRQWANAFVIGAFFFFGNHSLIGTAAKLLPSGVVALIVATEVPMIAVLSAALLPGRPLTWRTIAGSLLGIAGVAWLFVGVGGERPLLWPSMMVFGAAMSWSVGAVISQRLDAPRDPVLRSGMQMLAGGVLLSFGSVLNGEPMAPASWSSRSMGSLAFLIVFASVLAFFCYTWLLERVRTEAVATHVFVNPLIATALGAGLANERIMPAQLAAGALILASVLVLVWQWPPRRVAGNQST